MKMEEKSMPRRGQGIPIKVVLLLFAAMVAVMTSILLLIQLIPYNEMSWYLLDALWDYETGLPTTAFYTLLIIAIVLAIIGLWLLSIGERGWACVFMAIAGLLFGLLLYISIPYIILYYNYWI
jgi:uncharacterized membrane protein